MKLTKPAAVGFQLVGAILMLLAIGGCRTSLFWSIVMAIVGGYMFVRGRKPDTQ